MQQIPAIQSLRSDSSLKVNFSKTSDPRSNPDLESLLKQIQSKPPSERQWEVERWQQGLKQATSEQKNQWHQNILQAIDQLESQGIKQRNPKNDSTQRYGLLMDLYHASRFLRDSLPPDSSQTKLPAKGHSLPSLPFTQPVED